MGACRRTRWRRCRGPFCEETAEEAAEEADEEEPHEEPPVPGKKKRVLRRAISGEPVQHPSLHEEVPVKGAAGKAAQRQEAQPQPAPDEAHGRDSKGSSGRRLSHGQAAQVSISTP